MNCNLFDIRYLIILIALTYVAQYVVSYSSFPILLIISMDAFRHDYVDKCITPTLYKMRSKGVYAPYIQNVFPTKTFPNHHTLATGVYPEIHGVLDNSVYIAKAPCENKSVVGYSYELFHANDEVIPLWTLNQMAGQGRHSGVMMWPGGDFPYGERRIRPAFWRRAAFNVSYKARVNEVIRWFTHPVTPANLVFMYLEEPDLHGHAYGIESKQVQSQLARLDQAVAYLLEQLNDKALQDLVNIFILSDHGMVSIKSDHIVDLSHNVDPEMYIAGSYSPVLQIFPKQGSESEVLSGLLQAQRERPEALDVYKREEIPKIWHYAGSPRAPPILVVAKEGYAFQDLRNTMKEMEKRFHIRPSPNNRFGIHGYDNQLSSMKPMFEAWGPAIKCQGIIEPFDMTRLFPTWATILGLSLNDLVGPFALPLSGILRADTVGQGVAQSTMPNAESNAEPMTEPCVSEPPEEQPLDDRPQDARSRTERTKEARLQEAQPQASAQGLFTKEQEPPEWMTTLTNYISWITGLAATIMGAIGLLAKFRRSLRSTSPQAGGQEANANTTPICLDPRLRHDLEAQHLLTSSDCEDA